MWRTGRRFGDRFNSGLAVWIVALSAIIPALDRELMVSETVIASGDHEACVRPHHNHTLCLQFGKQRWSTGSAASLQVFPPAPGEAVSLIHDGPLEFLRRVPTHSRAPPRTT